MMTYMNPDLIRSVKMAALERDVPAFEVMEQAVRLWLDTQATPRPAQAVPPAKGAGSAAEPEGADDGKPSPPAVPSVVDRPPAGRPRRTGRSPGRRATQPT